MNVRRNKWLVMISLLFVLIIVTACNSDTENAEKDSEQEAKERTMTHAMGETTIPENPERILAPYLEDSLVALGEQPVAQWSIGDSVLDYLQPELKDIPKIGWDLPIEQTIEQNPDLIIFSSPSALQNGSYDDYNNIAPTYVMEEETNADWRAQLTAIGEILDKKEEAEKVLNDFDQKVEDAKSSLKNSIGDESVAFVWTTGEQFYVFDNTRYAAEIMYEDMGITQPEFIKNLPEGEEQWNPISLEKLGQMDADHVFLIGAEGEPGLEILENSSVWQNTPAAKSDQVYLMNEPSHWTIDGVIAHEMTIDKVVNTLSK
ncbi:iron-hydroxamate ABC transporter substrate-binding protein [Halobacillus sp. ACCC02827]|uniref:iron-hydroxamate ABC transporter substrate-binding protein n=1 Tax=unclassified Halobacillus TaxID=2636472 RepID=UPI0002A50945|nr:MULTISPECIES: iron-hydroxamate ABC transporter substrate-binding protein [unclassified Halobacillus]ELK47485.1 ferrichrome ABC transporter extracellular binding protein [Halobacillus sp. BAB-2008]WJE16033.1 iron-hydroxamate ABC transporter substrate-binding protein [Halobacillus sp. ACCC02827]